MSLFIRFISWNNCTATIYCSLTAYNTSSSKILNPRI